MSPTATQFRKAGGSVSYTVSVRNNNSSGCTSNRFAIQPSAPIGWTVAVASAFLSITPGGSASTTVSVGVPLGTPDNIYSATVTAANTASVAGTASVTGSVGVYSSLGVGVVSDLTSYLRGQTPWITATITALGTPMARATANFTIIKPNGRYVTSKVTTSSNGAAVYKYRTSSSDPVGVYTVIVNGSLNGALGSGTTTFTLY